MLKSRTKKKNRIKKDITKLSTKLMMYQKKSEVSYENIQKEIDTLLLHTSNDDIPTTNNSVELYFGVTLNRRLKKRNIKP